MSSFVVILNQNKELEKEEAQNDSLVQEINLDIKKEFENDMELWGAKFDELSLTMTFSRDSTDNPIIMFDNGSEIPTDEYRNIIRDFCPRYFNKVKAYILKDSISEIEINGHTSSEWLNNSTKYTSYMENMNLSQRRSENVFKICISAIGDSIQKDEEPLLWLFIKKTSANGKSWSDPKINSDGIEDRDASRRVEFRIITSIDSKIEELPSSKL
jgi:flagellar motor protein MotB